MPEEIIPHSRSGRAAERRRHPRHLRNLTPSGKLANSSPSCILRQSPRRDSRPRLSRRAQFAVVSLIHLCTQERGGPPPRRTAEGGCPYVLTFFRNPCQHSKY